MRRSTIAVCNRAVPTRRSAPQPTGATVTDDADVRECCHRLLPPGSPAPHHGRRRRGLAPAFRRRVQARGADTAMSNRGTHGQPGTHDGDERVRGLLPPPCSRPTRSRPRPPAWRVPVPRSTRAACRRADETRRARTTDDEAGGEGLSDRAGWCCWCPRIYVMLDNRSSEADFDPLGPPPVRAAGASRTIRVGAAEWLAKVGRVIGLML